MAAPLANDIESEALKSADGLAPETWREFRQSVDSHAHPAGGAVVLRAPRFRAKERVEGALFLTALQIRHGSTACAN